MLPRRAKDVFSKFAWHGNKFVRKYEFIEQKFGYNVRDWREESSVDDDNIIKTCPRCHPINVVERNSRLRSNKNKNKLIKNLGESPYFITLITEPVRLEKLPTPQKCDNCKFANVKFAKL